MPIESYPPGSVRALLDTSLVSPTTKTVLHARLAEERATLPPRFFDAGELATLRAVCARLLAIDDVADAARRGIDPAADLDARLASGEGDGWRYDALPPDGEAHRQGLRGFDETAQALFGCAFAAADKTRQDAVIDAVWKGDAPGATWKALPSALYREELLAEVVESYYSHPLAQEEIGYAGMADAHGWRTLGLNQLEAWETPAGASLSRDELSAAAEHAARRAAGEEHPIPDAPVTKRYTPDEEVDAVVVGTGAGGAPLLASLAAAGLRVVALEAGRHWSPRRDFATDERAQSPLFWNDERLSAGGDPLSFGRNNSGTGVGGSTLHYTAYVPRPQPADLRLRSDCGVAVDWPLSYDDLAPYYDRVERVLGVSGPSPYPWGPERTYLLGALPLNGAAQLMERGAAALGVKTSPAPNAALSAPYYYEGVGMRGACTNRGFCQAGCSVGAKGSTDVTFIPMAMRAGAEVRPACYVVGVERDGAGKVTAVLYEHDGAVQRQACKALFLCMGAVETPRFLLQHDLANSSGQVGRNFMAHTGVQVWGRFDEDVRPYKGIPGGLISEDFHRPAGADFAGGYVLQSIGVMPVTYASQAARGRGLWGEALREHMRGYNHTAGINILGDCLPYDHNYLELSDEKDARGLPKPRIHFTYGENEKRMTAHANALMKKIWTEAGAKDIWSFPRSAHIIGTCRMGADAREAVVDPDGRSFDVPNLYVMDNSVFPTALGVNPALTIMALSLRVADRFLARARQGEV